MLQLYKAFRETSKGLCVVKKFSFQLLFSERIGASLLSSGCMFVHLLCEKKLLLAVCLENSKDSDREDSKCNTEAVKEQKASSLYCLHHSFYKPLVESAFLFVLLFPIIRTRY